MKNKKKLHHECMFVAHYLSIDSLFLYLFFVGGFLVAEMVLPGIFSQRIPFFFLYLGLFASIGLVTVLGFLTNREGRQKEGNEKLLSWRMFLIMTILVALPFVLVLKSVNLFMLPFLALALGGGIVFLSRKN